jgi:hypothetical protein
MVNAVRDIVADVWAASEVELPLTINAGNVPL